MGYNKGPGWMCFDSLFPIIIAGHKGVGTYCRLFLAKRFNYIIACVVTSYCKKVLFVT